MRVRAGLLVLSLGVMAGCSTGVATPAAIRPAPTNTNRPSIVYAAVGASETLGVGATRATTDAWPQVFFRTALPPAAIYYNFGLSGDTVSEAQSDQAPEALGIDPTLVTVWLNVNDLLAGVPPASYRVQLQGLVHALRRDGKAQVLVANTPYVDRLPVYLACQGKPASSTIRCPMSPVVHLEPAAINGLVDAYNVAIAAVVKQEGAVLVDLHARGEIPDTHPEWVSADGFHPSSAGYAAIAAIFAERYRDIKPP